MVSGSFLAPLSDLLGRAFGLSRFAIRRPVGTGGQPNHPESARPSVHRYHDELHVPQRGVVVLLDAYSTLLDVPLALLGRASIRTVAVAGGNVCSRIFRPL